MWERMKTKIRIITMLLFALVLILGNTIIVSASMNTAKRTKTISAGITSAAITEDGSLYTWGQNLYGTVGNGKTGQDNYQLVPTKILNNVKSVDFGNYYGGAITEDGSLYMWGYNAYGQIGNGTTVSQTTPTKILSNVKSISLSSLHSAAITEDGSLYMWGYNSYGQVGNGKSENQVRPVKILSDVVSVAVGHAHSAAITKDGSLYMWGANGDGKIGNGTLGNVDTENNQLTPVKVLSNVISVSLGTYHSAAITKDGSLYMWGSNSYGQIGNGTKTNQLVPQKVFSNVKVISLGRDYSAAITEDGSLYMWGHGYDGQLGNGQKDFGECQVTPVKVLSNVKSISGSAAVTKEGDLYVWGPNDSGQIGNGTYDWRNPQLFPKKVLSNVVDVSMGNSCILALRGDCNLYAWGSNNCGQVGNGTTTNQLKPTKILDDVRLQEQSINNKKPVGGACGNTLTWELNFETGRLTIGGTGEMTEYASKEDVPWYEYRDCITEITIGEEVESLCEYAFYECVALERIYFNAKNMNDLYEGEYQNSFKEVFCESGNNENGIKVTVGKNVTKIPAGLFYEQSVETETPTKISEVVFEDGSICESIGAWAFRQCEFLTDIIIPQSVKEIGEYAFWGCSSLLIQIRTQELPEILGDNWSDYAAICINPKKVGITEYGQKYWITNEDTVCVWKYFGNKSKVVIPNEIEGYPVVEIMDSAFANCSYLHSITIPEYVTSIGDYAFWNCVGLKEIYYNAVALNDLDQNKHVFSYESPTWDNNNITLTIGRNVTRIPAYLFYSYHQSHILPITTVIFEAGSSCKSIGDYAFYNGNRMEKIKIPKSVTNIGNYVFEGCFNLLIQFESNEIPESLGTLWSGAGAICLNPVKFGVTEYGQEYWLTSENTAYVWRYKGTETTVTIPEKIEDFPVVGIAASAFYNKYELTNIDIPESVTDIGNYAFYYCVGLEKIRIPENVDTIGLGAFLETATWTTAGPIGGGYDYEFGWTNKIPDNAFYELIDLTSVVLPNTISNIGNYAFYNCESLKDITLPDGISNIGNYAFYECWEMNTNIPSNVRIIGEKAFYYCWELKEIRIPASTVKIGKEAFAFCRGVKNVYFDATAMRDFEEDDRVFVEVGSKYVLSEGGFTLIIGNNVTRIPAYMCSENNCNRLLEVVFEEGSICYQIGAHAFENSGRSCELPSSVRIIGDYAFYDCGTITNIMAENIGEYAFSYCGEIIDVNAASVGAYAFYCCKKITNVTVGDVGDYAFYDCGGLTNVTVEDVGDYAFEKCDKLVSVTITEGATSIGEKAFRECYDIEELHIPISIRRFGDWAFEWRSIDNIYYAGSKLQWDSITWDEYEWSNLPINYAIESESNDSQKVYFLKEWDEENKKLYFSNGGIFSFDKEVSVSEQTDESFFESVADLIGKYVLVDFLEYADEEGKESTTILKTAVPVENHTGTISSINSTTVVISGNMYNIQEDCFVSDEYVNEFVLYHLYQGELIGVTSLQKNTGRLKYWNTDTRQIEIQLYGTSSSCYLLSNLADDSTVAFLGDTGNTDRSIRCITDGNGFVYCIEKYTPSENNNDYPNYYDTYVPLTEDQEKFFNLAEEWMKAYNSFVEAVDNAMKAFAGSDEEMREMSISKRAKAMQKSDQDSSSKYLSGHLGSYENEAYNALATFLYDYACENAEFSSVDLTNSMANTTIVNNILSAMWGKSKEYSYENVTIAITAMGYGKNSTFGKMDIFQKLENGTSVVYKKDIVICSSKSDCEEAVAAYVEELRDLASNAAYNVATAVYKDILGKPLSSLTKDYVSSTVGKIEKKLAVKLTEKFKNAGVGNIIRTLDECYTYYDYIYKTANSGNLDDFLTAMPKVLSMELEFKDKSIKDYATSKAMKVLNKVVKKFRTEYEEYLEDLGCQGKSLQGKYQINCPVDVKVYNSDGEQIGYVGYDDIWYSEDIRISEMWGAKQIFSYKDDCLSFEMIATDYGTMDCSFEEYDDNNNPLGRLNYYDISLSPEQTFKLSLAENLKANENSLAITTYEEKIFADEYISVIDSAEIEIKANIEGEGKVTGIGTYVRGDAVILNALPAEGYKFIGWYEEDALVSASSMFEFTATENKYLYAKFYYDDYVYVSVGASNGGEVIGNGRYIAGNTATVIAIAEENNTFIGWYNNDVLVSEDTTYQFKTIENIMLMAKFQSSSRAQRIYGENRYNTAFEVATKYKEVLGVEMFDSVVIATGKNFADALAGSYLAVEKNAPILLTNGQDSNVAQVHEYIEENVAKGGSIYVLGGEAAVPSSIEEINGYDVIRLFGNSRYDTNLAILEAAGVKRDSIIIATGKNFADTLSASSTRLPILLVKPNGTLNDAQKTILSNVSKIYIVGGEGAVSKEYEEELAAYGMVERIYGASRYDTSVAIAYTFFDNVDTSVVASGKNFPDGLCGGPLAAMLNAPLILTKDNGTEAATAYVERNGIISGYVLGGDGALSDETVMQVFQLKDSDKIILN